jgi:pyruvate kinase
MTVKDREAIALGVRRGIGHVALSFASSAEDVALIRSLVPSGTRVISKIESGAGVRNMDGIIDSSDAVLIDRGDLSREVPLEYVPYYQKAIVRRANRWSRPVYVPTTLLESMIDNRRPTIAEANDIANTLLDGVHGLVLAAETAIGRDPVGTVKMVARMIRAFEWSSFTTLLERDQPPLVSAS